MKSRNRLFITDLDDFSENEYLRILVSHMAVFEDQLNDFSMFKVAGHRIAVSNAHPQILTVPVSIAGMFRMTTDAPAYTYESFNRVRRLRLRPSISSAP
jgi:hypothetical protein